ASTCVYDIEQPGLCRVVRFACAQRTEAEMLNQIQRNCPRSAEIVEIMGAAFGRVCQCLSLQLNGNDDIKKKLALIILAHVDRGERDAARISRLAFQELAGADRSVIGDDWATG